jgi:hypothetical protein
MVDADLELAPAGRPLAVVGTLEVVAGGTARATGAVGARAPGCAEVVEAAVGLAARAPSGLAASPTRDPESAMLLSVSAAAREGVDAAEVAGVFAAGDLGAVPPIPGIPNPAGDVGLPLAGAWLVVGADAGGFAGEAAGADVEACDVALEEVGAGAPLPAEYVSTGPSGSNN